MAASTCGNGTPRLHHQAAFGHALLGLAAASTAITQAVTEPPPWIVIDRNAYFVALIWVFFAGMIQVVAAFVWASDGGRDHVAGGKLVMNVMSYASLAVAGGLTAALLLL